MESMIIDKFEKISENGNNDIGMIVSKAVGIVYSSSPIK